jgi:glutathione S-transferase
VRRAVGDPAAFSRSSGDGRMGYLLYRHRLVRRLLIPRILGSVFAVNRDPGRDPIAELPALLDRIDGWIDDGILGGDQLNAADFMVVPSLALILYRPDARPLFEGRPTLDLVDRLLPKPA